MLRNALKSFFTIFLALFAISCSPSTSKIEYSSVSAEVSSFQVYESPYSPSEIYTLNALDEDFLNHSFQLPYYKDKTHDLLYDLFMNSANSYQGASSSINAILPDTVVFGNGNFAYDKLTGAISRTCKDPQCLHIRMLQYPSLSCPFISGTWVVCRNSVFSNRIHLGYDSLTADVFTTDFSFAAPHYADLPEGTVVEGSYKGEKLVLRKEQLVPYIDSNGVQRYKQADFELYLYDTDSKKAELVFAPNDLFSVIMCANNVFCLKSSDNALYTLDADYKMKYISSCKKVLAVFENKICYIDKESGDALCYDAQTGETVTWVDKDSPLTTIQWSSKFGDRLYFRRLLTYDEVQSLDFIDKRELDSIFEETYMGDGMFYFPVIDSCDLDGNDTQIVYYTPDYVITGFALDGEVLYTSGYDLKKASRFAAFDMSSGIELRINIPYSEYHYPGEYGYDENWRNGFR